MSYSRRAYTEMAKILADEIDSIHEDDLMADEIEMCVSSVRSIAVGIADLFTDDNPNGFDRARFFKGAGITFLINK